MKDFFLAVLSFFTSLSLVLLFIVVGWYIVWVAFLSRFKLMRELLSRGDDDQTKQGDQIASKSDSQGLRKTRTRRRRMQEEEEEEERELEKLD